MKLAQELLYLAAEYLPVWRDAAIVVLATIVLACLWLYAELGSAP